jgi:hypothetical protein
MGGAPNYSKGRDRLQGWASAKSYYEKQNINVKPGRGKYPDCLTTKPCPGCPKESPADTKIIPKERKFCPEHLESKFHLENSLSERLKRLQDAGLPTKFGSSKNQLT